MEVFGSFGFMFGVAAFIMASYSISEIVQLKKEVKQLRRRLREPTGA
jgi:hypothetical protein